MKFAPEEQNAILRALEEKGIKGACPMCSHIGWVLGDCFTPLTLQKLEGPVILGGPFIPAIALICKKCGFISLHSSKILVGLPKEEVKE